MAKKKTEADPNTPSSENTMEPDTKTETVELYENEVVVDRAVLLECYRLFWLCSHKFLKPSPTKRDVDKAMKLLRTVAGDSYLDEHERKWR